MLNLNDGCSKLWRPSRSLAQGQTWFVWFGTGITGVWLITAYLNIHDTEVVKIVEVPPTKRARSSKTNSCYKECIAIQRRNQNTWI